MDVGLPRETQQIDRVVEAFAARYVQCNPNLFSSDGESIPGLHFWTPLIICVFYIDHPYILAFSLIMLHTDAFNKSNKRKMTKQDYIKNTRLPGVAPEVLDVSPSSVIPETILYPCAGDGIFECLFISGGPSRNLGRLASDRHLRPPRTPMARAQIYIQSLDSFLIQAISYATLSFLL